jgi:hypothetical protein
VSETLNQLKLTKLRNNTMKRTTNVITPTQNRRPAPRAALLLAAVALVCGPVALRADHLVPFKASFTTVVESALAYPILHVSWLGQGHATHLGAATAISTDQMVDVTSGAASATWTMTGADGASMAIKATFQATFVSQTQVTFEGSYTVTGGTGRFAGASGGGTFKGSATLQTPTSGVGEFTMTGTISPPGQVDVEEIRANAGASFVITPAAMKMTVDGVAQVSVLGNCSTHADAEMRFGPGGSMQVTQSTFWFTSADGTTTINAVADGPVTPDPANPQAFGNFHYLVTFIGGTGRFASVGGKGQIDGAALFDPSAPGTGTGTFTLKGVLEIPENHQH